MKRIAVALLIHVALFSAAVSVSGAAHTKFRPATFTGASDGQYLVTLNEEAATNDPAALRQELALIYGAKLKVNASADAHQFAVIMTSARARLLSDDPRVSEVAEVPLTTSVPAETAPTTVSSARLKPRPSGYGDNGQSGTYTYDGSGNITAIGADTFVYDTAQRLVSSATRGVQENYTYDAFGNRTSATGAVNCLGQTTCGQTVTTDSITNHLATINGAAVTYDAAGNIKTIAATSGSPGATYSYDGAGMMTEAAVGSDVRHFIYAADDERIAVKQGASWTWTVRDQSGKVLREFTSIESGPNFAMTDWHWAKDYVWRDGLLLATVSPSGTLHYHLDHLGTPRLVTDANGVKVAEHAYYPFGAEINLTPHETPEEAIKFTGHERDLVAGDGHSLDYMHARYNNSSLGRFLSVDPYLDLKKTIRNPQKWNRYAYVRNSPISLVDPDGKDDVSVGDDFTDPFGTTPRRSDVGPFIRSALHIDELKEAFSGFGSAPLREQLMAGMVGLIAGLDVGSNFLAPEKSPAGVLLGENMARVGAGAGPMGLKTFTETGATFAETMAKNMRWLGDQIKSGARIFDIGLDVSRGGRSGVFFKAEVAFMENLGYQRQFVKLVEVDGKTYRMYEWVRPTQ